jgi:hypothetical protein
MLSRECSGNPNQKYDMSRKICNSNYLIIGDFLTGSFL